MTYVLPEGRTEKCPECGRSVVSYGEIHKGLWLDEELGKRICAYCSYRRQRTAMIKYLQSPIEPPGFSLEELEHRLSFKGITPGRLTLGIFDFMAWKARAI